MRTFTIPRTCTPRSVAVLQQLARNGSSRLRLTYRSWIADDPSSYAALPRVDIEHGYTESVLHGTNPHSRSGTLLFVSVHRAGTRAADHRVGFAVGYFPRPRSTAREVLFHIVHVHVDPAFRRSRLPHARVSSRVVEELVRAVTVRAHRLFPRATSVVLDVDPSAPCFQIGNPEYMSDRRSQTLLDMYRGAGFEVHAMPHLGPTRRRVERRVTLLNVE